MNCYPVGGGENPECSRDDYQILKDFEAVPVRIKEEEVPVEVSKGEVPFRGKNMFSASSYLCECSVHSIGFLIFITSIDFTAYVQGLNAFSDQ